MSISLRLQPKESDSAKKSISSTKLFDLSGRVAVVNGGIGRGIALGLAKAGSSVAVLARNEEKNERVMDP